MKTFLLLLITVSSFAQVAKQTDNGTWYYEYMDPACKTGHCPIYIFLHGSGERGDGTANTLPKIQNQGTPRVLKLEGKTYLPGFIMVCPQQTTNNSGWVTDPKDPLIIKLIKYYKKTYPHDNRRFVSGLSMGGGGAWDASYNSYGSDSLVTAIVPVSAGGEYGLAATTVQRKIPVWAIHGDKDGSVPISTGWRPVNGMLYKIDPKLQSTLWYTMPLIDLSGTYPLRWSMIKGGTHSSTTWDIIYSLTPRSELGNTTIYDWMKSQGKAKPPDVQQDSVISGYVQSDSLYHVLKSGRKVFVKVVD